MRWPIWIEAARPRTLPAAVAPVVVGTALAFRDGGFEAGAAALCLVFALLVQIGANFANDYSDFVRGADTPSRVGPRRAVASGAVSPAGMRRATALVLAAAFAVGLGLLRRGGPWMLPVGIACILGAVSYTGGPVPLGYRGWGDAMVFIFFGMVGVGATYFVQAGRLRGDAVLAAVPIGLLAANILVVNNFRDAETDAAAGKRTLVVRFGRPFARAQYAASLGVALAIPVVFWRLGFGLACLLPLLLVPLALREIRRLRAGQSPGELTELLAATARFLALYAALFALGMIL